MSELSNKNSNIQILNEYVNAQTDVIAQCRICKYVWSVNPCSLIRGHGCPKCSAKMTSKRITLTHEEFILRFENCNNEYVSVIGKYRGTDLPIKCKCLICGEEFESTPYRILHGTKHIKCARKLASEKRKCNYSDLVERIHKINPDIELLGEYVNFHTKMKFKCICGEICEATPDHLVNGGLCYACGQKRFKGEEKITEYLSRNNYIFIKQFKTENCKSFKKLSFDFAILNNEIPMAFIEYDGEQHFEPVDFAGKGKEWALQNLEKTKFRDEIKNQYCKDNNIPLLRIPYWEYNNIDKLVNEFIIKITI